MFLKKKKNICTVVFFFRFRPHYNICSYPQIKHIILLNCGGCVDIVDILQPPEDIIFFVADNHRPLDICNIYNADQVSILWEFRRINKKNEETIDQKWNHQCFAISVITSRLILLFKLFGYPKCWIWNFDLSILLRKSVCFSSISSMGN